MTCLGLFFFLLAAAALGVASLPTEEDMNLIAERRKADVIRANNNPSFANQLRNEMSSYGTWTDVDYTTGCDARRANWPARDHFRRILIMASYWAQNQPDDDMLQKIHLAMNHWFDNDFQPDDCINAGGRLGCPCGTPGYWNTNWYCQMIQIPTMVGEACLLLQETLTAAQLDKCRIQTRRAYDRIDGDPNGSMGPMTGANMLDVSSIAIFNSLITANLTLLEEAYGRYYKECQLTYGPEDGIKVDGTYFQHDRQVYTGNYGKVFINAMLKTFIHTADTSLSPPESVREAFLVLIDGAEWFMFQKVNEVTPKLMWQYSVIGRMVSHRYEDWSGIDISLNELISATESWENHQAFLDIANRLKANDGNVNPGKALVGTRFFHVSDYLVHRGQNCIITLKMYSERSTNSECNNNQNPFGFHLSDGAIYTFLDGSEYVNVYGAWDWDLIPGTTVDHEATPLACNHVQFRGKETFVGAVASGKSAVAVMNYTNPMTGSLHWEKAYFFFPGSIPYVVQYMSDIVSLNKSSPVYTTLDQRQLRGQVFVDGREMVSPEWTVTATSVWHDGVGYAFLNPVRLNLNINPRPSNWSAIGISEGFEPQTLFSATVEHPEGTGSEFAYIVELNVDQAEFEKNRMKSDSSRVKILSNSRSSDDNGNSPTPNVIVRGADFGDSNGNGERIIGLAFWEEGYFVTGLDDVVAVRVDVPVLVLLQRKSGRMGWEVALSDPSQSKAQVNIMIQVYGKENSFVVQFPAGAYAGSTTTFEF